MIPLGERHLRRLVRGFSEYYNHARLHMSLGPGVPIMRRTLAPPGDHRHSIRAGCRVKSDPVLGGYTMITFLSPSLHDILRLTAKPLAAFIPTPRATRPKSSE